MNIQAVIVTYYPEISRLNLCIESLIGQVNKIHIINNGDFLEINLDNYSDVYLQNLNKNYGIGFAQNIGIKKTLEEESDYVLLSDQDTIFPENYVVDMLATFGDENKRVIAIAPLFKDLHSKRDSAGFIFKTKYGFKTLYPKTGVYEIHQAIASGLIIKSNLISKVGYMNENLFIDWVDLEWCWRAIKNGFKILGNANITISHVLGDKSINLGYRTINLRSPVRNYYITRNCIYLAINSKQIDLYHRINLLIKSFRYMVAFPLLTGDFWQNLELQMKALKDGVAGQLGPL
jgi:rhamnosyltransferase